MSVQASRRNVSFVSPRRQRGATLYVALIMLVLLSMIGIVAMQVTSLQERMSSNYRAVNMAFQLSERLARQKELDIESQANSGGAQPIEVDEPNCDVAVGFDPTEWAQNMSHADPVPQPSHTRRIDECIAGNSSVAMGGAVLEKNPGGQIYQITAYSADRPVDPSSDAVIDTIFVP